MAPITGFLFGCVSGIGVLIIAMGRIGAEEQVSLQLGLSLTQSFVKLGAGHIIKCFQSYLDNIYQYMTNIFITSWAQLKPKLGFT